MNFGVIGFGYWGPNIVRNLLSIEGARVLLIADRNPIAQARAHAAFPTIKTAADARDVTHSSEVDAVAIVTPVCHHYELAKAALENGKHVFVEKPFTSTAAQAEELIELAEARNLRIMVDHTFLFTGAVKKIRELLSEGALGRLYYYDSTRVNLGLVQHDVNVLWDLAPHDLSIMDHLIHAVPEAIVATGQSHINDHEDVAYLTIYFSDKILAHINVNWLSPVKVRTTLIGGEKRMLVWNDLEADEKVKIYDRGVEIKSSEGVYGLLASYRSGDMWAPQLAQVEALHEELAYFVDCVRSNREPFNDGKAGLRVVKILEAASQSLKAKGKLIYL